MKIHITNLQAHLLEPVVWLLREGRPVNIRDLCLQLEGFVPQEECQAAFEAWVAEEPTRAGKFTTAAQTKQGLRQLVEEAINQLKQEGCCEVTRKGRGIYPRLAPKDKTELGSKVAGMQAASDDAAQAGLTLLSDGLRHHVAELREAITAAAPDRWGAVVRSLLVAQAIERVEASPEYHVTGEGDECQAWLGEGEGPQAAADHLGQEAAGVDGNTGEEEQAPQQHLEEGVGQGESGEEPAQLQEEGVEGDRGEEEQAPTAAQTVSPEIQIDPEFAALLPPPAKEELKQLEENLVADGCCLEPLVVWKGHGILLGGHHRLDICLKHSIPYTVIEVTLADREAAKWWIVANQLGKRNMSPEWTSYWRGEMYNARKKVHGGDRRSGESTAHPEQLKTTAEVVAEETGVSPATVRRDGKFAQAVDTIAEECGDEVKQAILSGETGASREEVIEVAKKTPEARKEAATELLASKGKPPRAKKATPEKKTITLPKDPEKLARALVADLGEDAAYEVYEVLCEILNLRQKRKK